MGMCPIKFGELLIRVLATYGQTRIAPLIALTIQVTEGIMRPCHYGCCRREVTVGGHHGS